MAFHTNTSMAKRKLRTIRHKTRATVKPTARYLVIVRSWILLVLFAIMLGVGAVVGTYLNNQLNQSVPQVAGVEIEAK